MGTKSDKLVGITAMNIIYKNRVMKVGSPLLTMEQVTPVCCIPTNLSDQTAELIVRNTIQTEITISEPIFLFVISLSCVFLTIKWRTKSDKLVGITAMNIIYKNRVMKVGLSLIHI